MTNLEQAKDILKKGGYTCVLCKADMVYTSLARGVSPLVHWLQTGVALHGFSAADKVIGKAAAMLFVLAGVTEVYAPVMSESAVNVLKQYGIIGYYDTTVASIQNRLGTGSCPMEMAVKSIQDPKIALTVIEATLKQLRNGGRLSFNSNKS